MLPRPCLAQQYLDHDGCFYKVYVIAHDVMVYIRPSLPNIQDLGACNSVAFDSRYCYPTLASFTSSSSDSITHDDNGSSVDRKIWQPSSSCTELEEGEILHQALQHTAQALREEFGLSLFGFDVILPKEGMHRPLVIDVNYFPSYKEVVDFPSRLRRFLRSLAFPTGRA
jgi:hypothetical protein